MSMSDVPSSAMLATRTAAESEIGKHEPPKTPSPAPSRPARPQMFRCLPSKFDSSAVTCRTASEVLARLHVGSADLATRTCCAARHCTSRRGGAAGRCSYRQAGKHNRALLQAHGHRQRNSKSPTSETPYKILLRTGTVAKMVQAWAVRGKDSASLAVKHGKL